ncbi:hypothetical protein WG66_001845 [Moniliophthora roreri]|nr:hypothetical protein WG66_001845 [Moniliophthora roreri]
MTLFLRGSGSAEIRVEHQGNWTVKAEDEIVVGVSENRNSSITIGFEGIYISMTGTLTTNLQSPNSSKTLCYTLDGHEDHSFPYNIWNSSSALLYTSPELPQGQHTLQLTLTSGAELQIYNVTFVAIDNQARRTIQTVPGSRLLDPPGHAGNALIGGIMAGVLLLGIFGAFLYRRKTEAEARNPEDEGPVQVHMPTSKEAFTSGNNGLHGLSFTRSQKLLTCRL